MEKKYFIASGKAHLGPFSLSELREKKLNPDTLIWREDLKQWTKVTEIAELKIYVIPVPPPTPEQIEVQIKKENKEIKQNITNRIVKKATIYTIVTYIVFFIVIFIVIGGLKSNFERYPTPYQYITPAFEPYFSMGIYVSSVQNLKIVLISISLFWSLIFSAICFVLFFIREKKKYSYQ